MVGCYFEFIKPFKSPNLTRSSAQKFDIRPHRSAKAGKSANFLIFPFSRAAKPVEAVNKNCRNTFLLVFNKRNHWVEFIALVGPCAFVSASKQTQNIQVVLKRILKSQTAELNLRCQLFTAFYSLLIAFTGFSRAALTACELIVNKAMTRAAMPDSKIVSGFTSI